MPSRFASRRHSDGLDEGQGRLADLGWSYGDAEELTGVVAAIKELPAREC